MTDATQHHGEPPSPGEEPLRLLLHGIRDYAIYMLDPDGHIATWSPGAQLLMGYAESEVLSRHFSLFHPEEEVARGWPDHELAVVRSEGRFEVEGWRVRKDGSRFWANVVITPLHDSEGALRGFAKVARDLTDRRKSLENAPSERRMHRFLSMLAHELRNPLAPIRNAVSIMRMQPNQDPAISRCQTIIDRQATHLTKIVDELLDITRIIGGKLTLSREPILVATLIERAVEECRPMVEARKHALQVRLPAEPLRMNGDPARLQKALTNLLDNAVKFTPSPGRITVSAARRQGYVELKVQDSGVGIAADRVPRIFDLFVQGEDTVERATGGLGIGLALAREIITQHGGSIEARCPGPNLGSEFIVRLPLVAEERDASALHPRDAEPGRRPRRRSRRVLVVDDNRDSADTMAALLGMAGLLTRCAYDGPSALKIAPEFAPDLVLLDIGLPGLNGYEVAERLRAQPLGQTLLLIAMTGFGQEEDVLRSRAVGFDHHLVKPIELPTLIRLLDGE
jgi:PAS domain S-box-containing protein